ncbi:hypothetical protein MY7_0368 [Bacillus sp. 5B6]|nr:hypothetical protein MY7_0368 [Bacillus sp. 5B6]
MILTIILSSVKRETAKKDAARCSILLYQFFVFLTFSLLAVFVLLVLC